MIRRQKWILLYSILFGVIVICTKEVFPASLALWNGSECLKHNLNFISIPNLFIFIISFLFSFHILNVLLHVDLNNKITQNQTVAFPQNIFIFSFVFNMIIWGIWLLVYFPGTGMNDTINALISPTGTDIQPIIYQFMISFLIHNLGTLLGNPTWGYATTVILQMLLMSFVISYILAWLVTIGVNNRVIYFLAIYYALMPAIGDYSIALLKDTLFSLSVLSLVALLYNIVKSNGEALSHFKTIFLMSCSIFVMLITRANGFIVAISIIILLLIVYKFYRKPVVTLLLIVIISNSCISFVKEKYYSSDSSFQEMCSVPMVQIGAVLNSNGQIHPEDKTVLENILPLEEWKNGYSFSFVDRIKFNSSFSREYLNDHKTEFLASWARILKDNLSMYIKSYMYHSYGFWNVSPFNAFSTDYTQSYFTKINNNTSEDSYWAKYLNEIGLQNIRIFPEKIFSFLNTFLTISFRLSLLLSPGMMIMIVFAQMALLFTKQKWKSCIYLLPLVIIWLTMMLASPASMIYRYSFYLVLTLPCTMILTMIELSRGGAVQVKLKST